MKRLVAEIDGVVGHNRPVVPADFASMPYLDAVLHETLRRYPAAAFGVPVVVTESFSLLDGKYELPVGTFAMANLLGLLRDPDVFPNPLDWNPQRWIDNPELRKSPNFVPFKMGARQCLGKFLAVAEAKTILVNLLQKFEFHPINAGEMVPIIELDDNAKNKPVDYEIRVSLRPLWE